MIKIGNKRSFSGQKVIERAARNLEKITRKSVLILILYRRATSSNVNKRVILNEVSAEKKVV